MATATNELVREFKVGWDGKKQVVTVTSLPSGAKSLTIDVGAVRGKGVSIPELDVIDKLRGVDKVSLNLGEMKLLAGLRDRCNSKATDNGAVGEVAKDTVVKTARGIEAQNFVQRGETHDERTVKGLEKTLETMGGQISMLIYDIPSSKNDVCPNPSGLLWHYGFRLNLSCWVLPEKGLKAGPVQELLHHWKQHHIETHVIPYHPEALAQIRQIARTKLEQEIIRIHTSLLTRLESAGKRLDEARKECESKWDERKAETKADNDARGILNNAIKAFSAALDCARAFDDTESTRHLFEGLRQGIEAERMAFNARMKKYGGKLVHTPPTI